MKYSLQYGKGNLFFELDDSISADVINPADKQGLENSLSHLKEAMGNPINAAPLSAWANKPDIRVGIVFSDITRASPSKQMIPVVLSELTVVPRENIKLFNASGTHRANTEKELRQILGDEIVENYQIIQNNSDDLSSQFFLGKDSYNHEIWINREFYECDVKILTGFIEPHMFAGFSGGGKAIMPGMAGWKTIFAHHSVEVLSDPKTTWGITAGNCFYEEILEIAGKVNNTFLVNVTMNGKQEITGVFCGELRSAHAAGCAFAKSYSMVPVSDYYDCVITSNSGYPLDLNLYQTVKGMSAAAQIVRPGGSIIMASECVDGIPDHGLFRQRLSEVRTPDALLKKIRLTQPTEQDQWQIYIFAEILEKAKVYLYSDGLTDDQIRTALLHPVHSISDTVTSLVPGSRICIMPQGPLTIPYVLKK